MPKLFALISFLYMLGLSAAKQPNIIFILADDVSPDMYGFYGNKEAKTPHIDKIAQDGVMFRTAWSSAICGPSRALIMTGSYANRTGAYYNGFFKNNSNGESFFSSIPAYERFLLPSILVGYYYHLIDKEIFENKNENKKVIKEKNFKIFLLLFQILI